MSSIGIGKRFKTSHGKYIKYVKYEKYSKLDYDFSVVESNIRSMSNEQIANYLDSYVVPYSVTGTGRVSSLYSRIGLEQSNKTVYHYLHKKDNYFLVKRSLPVFKAVCGVDKKTVKLAKKSIGNSASYVMLAQPAIVNMIIPVGARIYLNVNRNWEDFHKPSGNSLDLTRKGRADKALITSIINLDHKKLDFALPLRNLTKDPWDDNFQFLYIPGQIATPELPFKDLKPSDLEDNAIDLTCHSGIHFYLTPEEALCYLKELYPYDFGVFQVIRAINNVYQTIYLRELGLAP